MAYPLKDMVVVAVFECVCECAECVLLCVGVVERKNAIKKAIQMRSPTFTASIAAGGGENNRDYK